MGEMREHHHHKGYAGAAEAPGPEMEHEHKHDPNDADLLFILSANQVRLCSANSVFFMQLGCTATPLGRDTQFPSISCLCSSGYTVTW